MYRTIRFKNNSVSVLSGSKELRRPAEGEKLWVDLQQWDEAELRALEQEFGFHPLAIQDCIRHNERAKLDDYDDYLFIVTHSMSFDGNGRRGVATMEVNSFLGQDYLVTVHREPVPAIDDVIQRIEADHTHSSRGMDFVLYLIVDELVDETFPIIDKISDQLEDIEASILKRIEPGQLRQLMRTKRLLISMRRVLSPERDVLAMLLRRGDRRIDEHTALYFRDVYDHVVRSYEQIDVERDLLGNAMDAYMSMNANRSTIIMKQLTILASIFLPLSFMTGFFGQNFSALPFDSKSLFYIELGACIAVPIGMFYWFRRSGWL
jgi:magnesium transporter